MRCPRCGCDNSNSVRNCMVCGMPLSVSSGESKVYDQVGYTIAGNGEAYKNYMVNKTGETAQQKSYFSMASSLDGTSSGSKNYYTNNDPVQSNAGTYMAKPPVTPPAPHVYKPESSVSSPHANANPYIAGEYPTAPSYDNPSYVDPPYKNETYGKKKKPKRKRVIIISAISICLALIAVSLYLLIFSGRAKAKKAVKNCFEAIQSCDAEEVINATIPDKVIEELIDQLAYDDIDEDEFIDEVNQAVEDELGINSVIISDVRIGGVEKVSLKEYVDNALDDSVKDAFDEILEDSPLEYDDEVFESIDDIYKYVERKLKKYDVDVNGLYLVDVDYKLSIDCDDSENTYVATLIPKFIDKFLVYRADGKYYVLPDVSFMLGAFTVPALETYVEKSNESTDISNADLIAMAITTAWSEEDVFNSVSVHTDYYGEAFFEFSDDGLAGMGSEFKDEVISDLGSSADSMKQKMKGYKGDYFWVKICPYQNVIEVYRDEDLTERIYPSYSYYDDYYDSDYYGD